MHKDAAELRKSMRGLAGVQTEMALNHWRIAELIEIESQRLDRHDEAHRQYERWQQQFQREAQRRHEEALARLDRILEKLTGNNPKPN